MEKCVVEFPDAGVSDGILLRQFGEKEKMVRVASKRGGGAFFLG